MLTRGAPRAQPIELNILGCDSMPRSERSDGSPHALGGSRTLHRACEPITTTPVDGHADERLALYAQERAKVVAESPVTVWPLGSLWALGVPSVGSPVILHRRGALCPM